MAQTNIHYFGIRHHGPGSARRLAIALEQIKPSVVLVEGPADCTELYPMLVHPQTRPPVALLSYATDDASTSVFYPFVEYSPEYQACLYAVQNSAELEFIDLPIAVRLAQMQAEHTQVNAEENTEVEVEPEVSAVATAAQSPLVADPISVLAQLACYEDGEAWWNDLIEQNADDSDDLFSTVELAIAELRQAAEAEEGNVTRGVLARDLPREAHMRLAITKAAKQADGPVAVVCGAWHVPALKAKHTAKSDRELIKNLPTKLAASKVKSTWVPWTSPRLATGSGYGAGVSAPMWYQHLWQQRNNPNAVAYWLVGISQALREQGQVVSTASVIETVRLSQSLAAVRGRPTPGFEEIREAVIACLCFGEAVLWQQIEQRILLGNEVGQIPPDAPLVPLLEDLQRQQKSNKLKPEALSRELALDLRSQSGLGKSTLLHRLNILDVPWGKLDHGGGSRGTFRERWVLSWEPEYSVRLVEHLVYGSTIEQAASGKMVEIIHQQHNLGMLAQAVQDCLGAQLDAAAEQGIARLDERAALADDCIELLESLPSLVGISRYGTARAISLAHIHTLNLRLTVQAAIALPYAARNLNREEAEHYSQAITGAHQAILLAEMDEGTLAAWWHSLSEVLDSSVTDLQVAGLCARLLYQDQKITPDALQVTLQKMLSPGVAVTDAAKFFEGFFAGSVDRLLYDALLLSAVEQWLLSLSDDEFIEYLPLFRRMFSGLDATERKHLIDTVLKGRVNQTATVTQAINPNAVSLWPAQLERLGKLLKGDAKWHW